MKTYLKVLNRLYVIFMYSISFLAFLSLSFKLISLADNYENLYNNTLVFYMIMLICVIFSAGGSLILCHLLAKNQRK